MSYNIGDFDTAVQLLRHVSDGKDRFGREISRYEAAEDDVILCKASDVSGRDFYAAAAQQMEDVVTLTMRSGYGVNLKDRFRFVDPQEGIPVGQEYRIIAVNHLGYRGDFIQFRCRAVIPEAVSAHG